VNGQTQTGFAQVPRRQRVVKIEFVK
jgi:hypothetical protein